MWPSWKDILLFVKRATRPIVLMCLEMMRTIFQTPPLPLLPPQNTPFVSACDPPVTNITPSFTAILVTITFLFYLIVYVLQHVTSDLVHYFFFWQDWIMYEKESCIHSLPNQLDYPQLMEIVGFEKGLPRRGWPNDHIALIADMILLEEE